SGTDGCTGTRYYKAIGGGAGHAGYGTTQTCSSIPRADSVGAPYGNALLQPLIGGSGGGGGYGGANFGGGGGGGGGGALLIASSGAIALTWIINADGGGGSHTTGTNAGAHGAGGSGGAVRLVATSISGAGHVRAIGGCLSLVDV